jgi:2-dehydro-3-deoxyphosphogluconate aldolase/(4S)-4-hydroxy-2-oxoglutarate aldolase
MLKLFPAAALGGVDYLKAMGAPYNHLGLNYFPLGGVSLETLPTWAKMSNVITVGGSWIANKQLIGEHQFEEITKRAKAAQKIWKEARG